MKHKYILYIFLMSTEAWQKVLKCVNFCTYFRIKSSKVLLLAL